MIQSLRRNRDITPKITDAVGTLQSSSHRFQVTSPPPTEFTPNRGTNEVTGFSNHVTSPLPNRESVGSVSYTRSSSQSSLQLTEANSLNLEGRDLVKEGKFDQGMSVFHACLAKLGETKENTKTAGVAFSGIGECFEGKNNYQKALEFYLKALPISRESESWSKQIAGKIGELYLFTGNTQCALLYLSQAEKTPQIQSLTALCHDELDQKQEALDLLLNNPEPKHYDLIAALSEELGDVDQAKKWYIESFQRESTEELPPFHLRKDLKEAFKILLKSRAPDHWTARMACLFYDVDKHFKRYVRSVEAKAELFPDDPKVAD